MIESVIIIFCVFLIYFRLFNYHLIMDNYQWMKLRKERGYSNFLEIRNFNQFGAFIHERLYSGATLGTNVRNEHILTVCIYATICVFIYLALGHNHISFCAALLYACHPINNQVSLWSNGRRYAINILLVLAMMLLPSTSIFIYPFTFLLQVTAFFSPFLLVSHSPWFLLLIPVTILVAYKQILANINTRSEQMSDGDLKKFTCKRIIVIIKTFGFFFKKMLIPGVCSMQYTDRINWGLTKEGDKEAYDFNNDFYIGIGFFIIMGISYTYLPTTTLKTYFIFMILSLLQWCAIIPVTQILSDRYCSMPNIFFMYFLSYFSMTYMGIWDIIPLAIFLIYYLICLSVIFPMYKDLNSFYTYHFKYFPNLSWYRHNLIQDLMNEGKKEMAHIQTFEGLRHDPKDFRLLIWGCVMCILKYDFINAEVFLKEAEKNMYINKEKSQSEEIANLREQINKIMPIENKLSRMTQREKVVFMDRRKGMK